MKKIEWKYSKDGNIERFLGRINGVLMFEIYQFSNDSFTDPFILTSKVIPMEMKQGEDIKELKKTAQTLLEGFINNFLVWKHF